MVIWMFGFGIDGGFFVGAVEHVTNNEEDHRDERDFLSVSFFERTSKWWHVLLLLVEYYECENSLLDSLFILRYRHCDRDVKINKERVSIYQYGMGIIFRSLNISTTKEYSHKQSFQKIVLFFVA